MIQVLFKRIPESQRRNPHPVQGLLGIPFKFNPGPSLLDHLREMPIAWAEKMHPLVVRAAPAKVRVTSAEIRAVDQDVQSLDQFVLGWRPFAPKVIEGNLSLLII